MLAQQYHIIGDANARKLNFSISVFSHHLENPFSTGYHVPGQELAICWQDMMWPRTRNYIPRAFSCRAKISKLQLCSRPVFKATHETSNCFNHINSLDVRLSNVCKFIRFTCQYTKSQLPEHCINNEHKQHSFTKRKILPSS